MIIKYKLVHSIYKSLSIINLIYCLLIIIVSLLLLILIQKGYDELEKPFFKFYLPFFILLFISGDILASYFCMRRDRMRQFIDRKFTINSPYILFLRSFSDNVFQTIKLNESYSIKDRFKPLIPYYWFSRANYEVMTRFVNNEKPFALPFLYHIFGEYQSKALSALIREFMPFGKPIFLGTDIRSTFEINFINIKTNDTNWKDVFRILAKNARYIACIPDLSDGIKQELSYLKEINCLNKIIFYMPPGKNNYDIKLKKWNKVQQFLKSEIQLNLPDYNFDGLIFALNEYGDLVSKSTLKGHDYGTELLCSINDVADKIESDWKPLNYIFAELSNFDDTLSAFKLKNKIRSFGFIWAIISLFTMLYLTFLLAINDISKFVNGKLIFYIFPAILIVNIINLIIENNFAYRVNTIKTKSYKLKMTLSILIISIIIIFCYAFQYYWSN
jgi:hypothetical protein